MLLISIFSLLFSNAVTTRRDLSILFNRNAMIALTYCILHLIMSLSIISKGVVGLHGGLLQITNITQIFQIFLFFISIFILQLTSFYSRKALVYMNNTSTKAILGQALGKEKEVVDTILGGFRTKLINKMGEHLKIIEYPLILLFIISGAAFLMSTNDIVSIFLSIELQSYGLYILSTIYRNSELSTTGGLMYFLLGGLSSCFILLGSALFYANSGITSLDGLYVINSISSDNNYNITSWYKSYYLNFSLFIFSIGFLFKVSAAPYHFWSPDVYDAIPTIVTTFVAIIAKISIFILILGLVYNTAVGGAEFSWTYGLLVSSLLSLIIGTIVGLTQFRFKRLLAYSTISHVGFILLALSICSVESIQAFIFYLIQYSISNLNTFIILISIGFALFNYVSNNKEYKDLLDKNNSPVQLISQLRGYFYINSWLSLSLAITIFSFAGIPPLIGFFAKQMVLSAALDSGYIFLSLIAILSSVVGGVYYLGIIRDIFFYSPEHSIDPEHSISPVLSIYSEHTINRERSINPVAENYELRYMEAAAERLTRPQLLKQIQTWKSKGEPDNLIEETIPIYKRVLIDKALPFDKKIKKNLSFSYLLFYIRVKLFTLWNILTSHLEPYNNIIIITITSTLSLIISILSLLVLVFIFLWKEWSGMGAILAQNLFRT